jgi:hypothetical protein
MLVLALLAPAPFALAAGTVGRDRSAEGTNPSVQRVAALHVPDRRRPEGNRQRHHTARSRVL